MFDLRHGGKLGFKGRWGYILDGFVLVQHT